jgi:cystathionine gamma-synthase/cystathionine gamma-lyase/cystathionine beta-lyase
VARFARDHGLTSIIDSTFATPVNLRPIELGFDVVVHSATKYLNGHSDLVAGCVIGRAAPGRSRCATGSTTSGAARIPTPASCCQRGVKTLALARRGAEPERARDRGLAREASEGGAGPLPGLASHPQHERAKKAVRGDSAAC